MPYNFEPIPPADEVNGSTSLPLARVKRIIKLDEEIGACSNSAAFLVTVAAEMFIHYLAKQGLKGSQKDRRKNLQYKDLANAVAALDTLEFLSDTIPRTVPYKKIVNDRSKGTTTANSKAEAGQMTLNGRRLADPTATTSPEEEDGRGGRIDEDEGQDGYSGREGDDEEHSSGGMEDGDNYNGAPNGTINVSMNGTGVVGGSLRDILDNGNTNGNGNGNGSARKRRTQPPQQHRGEDEDEDMT